MTTLLLKIVGLGSCFENDVDASTLNDIGASQ